MSTYTEQIIQKMLEGGYHGYTDMEPHVNEDGKLYAVHLSKKSKLLPSATEGGTFRVEQIFLSPDAWRALGKAMDTEAAWYEMWHGLISHLVEGGTIESYCKELIENV